MSLRLFCLFEAFFVLEMSSIYLRENIFGKCVSHSDNVYLYIDELLSIALSWSSQLAIFFYENNAFFWNDLPMFVSSFWRRRPLSILWESYLLGVCWCRRQSSSSDYRGCIEICVSGSPFQTFRWPKQRYFIQYYKNDIRHTFGHICCISEQVATLWSQVESQIRWSRQPYKTYHGQGTKFRLIHDNSRFSTWTWSSHTWSFLNLLDPTNLSRWRPSRPHTPLIPRLRIAC